MKNYLYITNNKMTSMKQCNTCGKVKELTEYHKMTASKDGKQDKCKSCVKEMNKKFRETNPKYQVDWQRTNSKVWFDYMNDYKRADKSSLIYKITAPDDKVYIGQTKSRLGVRFSFHKIHYKNYHGRIPLLHQSFDKWGVDSHKFELLIDLGDLPRKELMKIESNIITAYQQKGISLNKK